jgi:hypothetical protein
MTRSPLPFLVCLLAAAPAHADDQQSFALTTDTPQYCSQLAKQITDRHSTMPDVVRLLADGTDMCGRGQIRGGIRRLRRALIVLHHHKTSKDQAAKSPPPKPAQPPKPPPKPADATPP